MAAPPPLLRVQFRSARHQDAEKCINKECPTHAAASGVKFEVRDAGDRDVCIHCHTVQFSGGIKDHDPLRDSYRESEDAEDRQYHAARQIQRERMEFGEFGGTAQMNEIERNIHVEMKAMRHKLLREKIKEVRTHVARTTLYEADQEARDEMDFQDAPNAKRQRVMVEYGTAEYEALTDAQKKQHKTEYRRRIREAAASEQIVLENAFASNGSRELMTVQQAQLELEGGIEAVKAELRPRVRELFMYVYENVMNNGKTEFGMMPGATEWFDRTLRIVADYKMVRKLRFNRQMRKVDLNSMHALIIASWKTDSPLTWGILHSVMADYQELKVHEEHELEVEALKKATGNPRMGTGNPNDPSEWIVPLKSYKEIGSRRSLDEKLKDFIRDSGIVVDWPDLVRRLGVYYFSELRQASGVFRDELDAQLDLGIRYYKSLPSYGSFGSPEAAVAAISCVRMVMQKKLLPVDETEIEQGRCIVTVYKAQYARKRKRPAITAGGQPGCRIKAGRFADIAGVSPKDVAEAMRFIPPAIRGRHYDCPK